MGVSERYLPAANRHIMRIVLLGPSACTPTEGIIRPLNGTGHIAMV